MLSWAFLAGAALTYLSAVALNLDRPLSKLAKPLQSNQESNRAELDRKQLSAKVRSLSDTVATLRTDLARIKESRPKQIAERSVATTRSMAPTMPLRHDTGRSLTTGSIETATPRALPQETVAKAPATPVEPPTASVDARQTPAPASVQTAATQPAASTIKPNRPRRNMATTPLRSGTPPLPHYRKQQMASLNTVATNVRTTARQYKAPILVNDRGGARSAATRTQPTGSANAIQTGTIPRATRSATATPAKPAAANTPRLRPPVVSRTPTVKLRRTATPMAALSLSQATSVTGLRASWLLLTTRHAQSFANYRPRYTKDSATGLYRLIAGPIVNRTEADRVCTTLRAQGVSCGVTNYSGTAF
jgi:SPOR domain